MRKDIFGGPGDILRFSIIVIQHKSTARRGQIADSIFERDVGLEKG